MKHGNGAGACFAAFGAGLLVAMICPTKLLLVLVAASLVLMGCSRAKR